MESLLLVFIGALIGAAAPVIVVFLQSRYQRREMLWKSAVEAAKHDHSTFVQGLKDMDQKGKIPPLSIYIYYYTKVLEHVERGSLTPEIIKELDQEVNKIETAIP